MKHNFCAWIDHHEAQIFGIAADDADKGVVMNERHKHHIHRKADHVRTPHGLKEGRGSPARQGLS